MNLSRFIPDSFFNWNLAKEPLNWAIVMVIASVWLLAFHVVVQGWLGLGQARPTIGAGPGQIAMLPDPTSAFTAATNLNSANDLSMFLPGGATGASPWGDSAVSRFAEDGWSGN